ncbi:MAG: hypothetical protein AB1730_00715 [Myxococcota bacterium]|jgi:hypothetical protein
MAFKASGKNGKLEIHGLEAFIEKKFAEFKKALGLAQGGKKASSKKKKAPAKEGARGAAKSADPLDQLLAALAAHPKGAQLAKAGKQKDQLLRSLIPLYLARSLDGVAISSGTTSRFWAHHGVKYAAPNAAKALREHVGYARRTAKGPQITPNGVKYVDAALAGKRKAA